MNTLTLYNSEVIEVDWICTTGRCAGYRPIPTYRVGSVRIPEWTWKRGTKRRGKPRVVD